MLPLGGDNHAYHRKGRVCLLLIMGISLSQKAHALRGRGFGHCLGHSSILGSPIAAGLEGLALLPRVELPQNTVNMLAFSLTEYARPVTLARHFQQFPTFLGIFSLKGLEGSPILLLLTHAFFVLQQLH